MHGKHVVLTGATGGLGRVIAHELSCAGAEITLAVRDPHRGRFLASSIPGSTVRFLDLADLSSIREFTEAWDRPIDVLINNAGVMIPPRRETRDGAEIQFGVNHLGHFALTNLLLPHITDRVVTVTSRAHMFGTINLKDPHFRRRRYNPLAAYGQSKLANLLFTLELQRRLTDEGRARLAVAADPGFVATGLAEHPERPMVSRLVRAGIRVAAQSPQDGARTILSAAGKPTPPGAWVGFDRLMGLRGQPSLVPWPAAAADPVLARRLWELSASETGVDFPGVGHRPR